MRHPAGDGMLPGMKPDSDLSAIPFILVTALAVLVVLAAFFFVGAVVGVIVLIVLVVLAIAAAARWMRRNDLS